MAVLSCEYYSLALQGFRSFTAILPLETPPQPDRLPGYLNGPFPTVYLLHGYSGSRNDYIRRSGIDEWASQHQCAVIMPDGGNRFYVDVESLGEMAGTFAGEELVKVTRRMFRLSEKREDTLVAGLSMGGYGAIVTGLRYSDVFGGIIAMSSALITDDVASGAIAEHGLPGVPLAYYRTIFGEPEKIPGSVNDPKALAGRCMEKAERPALFLSCGTEDPLYRNNLAFHEALNELGYEHTWWTDSGWHDFIFWNKALPAGLDWYFEKT